MQKPGRQMLRSLAFRFCVAFTLSLIQYTRQKHFVLALLIWKEKELTRYLDFYNCRRPHSSLDGGTPDQAYFNPPPIRIAA